MSSVKRETDFYRFLQTSNSCKVEHSFSQVNTRKLFPRSSPSNTSTPLSKCWIRPKLVFPSRSLLFELSQSEHFLFHHPLVSVGLNVVCFASFFRHLKASVDPSQAAISLSKLLPLLPQATENTLVLVLDAIQSCLKAGSTAVDGPTYALLIKALLETWFAKPEGKSRLSSVLARRNLAHYSLLVHRSYPRFGNL
jgi:hypothetical protein